MTSLWIKMPVALCSDFYYEMLFAGTPALAREETTLGIYIEENTLKSRLFASISRESPGNG